MKNLGEYHVDAFGTFEISVLKYLNLTVNLSYYIRISMESSLKKDQSKSRSIN